jgi:hypothetical protein
MPWSRMYPLAAITMRISLLQKWDQVFLTRGQLNSIRCVYDDRVKVLFAVKY